MACGARSGLKANSALQWHLSKGSRSSAHPETSQASEQLVQMGLQCGGGLLQDREGQLLSPSQTQIVTVIVDLSMRAPGPVRHAQHLMMGGEATVLAHKAKRGLRRQP